MKLGDITQFTIRSVSIALLCFVIFGIAQTANAEDFFVSPSFDALGRDIVGASERGFNNVLRIFVEDDWWDALSVTEKVKANAETTKILGEFRDVIYPGIRSYYGEEAAPGVDGDNRVVMLLSNLIDNAGGYFREGDQVSKSVNPISNEHEMLHLSADLLIDSDRFPIFLAHEFQHLITFNAKNIKSGLREEVWLNEMRSEYAPTVLKYDDSWYDSNLRIRAHAFFERSDESLLEWNGADHDYGQVRMFSQYLSEQFGSDVMARTISSGVGIPAVNNAIVKSGGTRFFYEVFKDWAVANYINSIVTDSRWGYQLPELRGMRVAPTQEVFIRTASTGVVDSTVLDWSARWHRFSSGGISSNPFFEVEFVQDDTTDLFKVAYVLERNDGVYEVNDLELVGGRGVMSVDSFGSVYKAVTMIPMSQTQSFFPDSTSAIARGYKLFTERSSQVQFSLDVVTPSTTPTVGGSEIFVRGSGLTEGARVFVDGAEASNVTLTGTTVLAFIVPPHVSGVVDVRVDLIGGSSLTLPESLLYIGAGVPASEETPAVVIDDTKEPAPALLDGILEGDLIRARGDIDVYIVKFINGKRFKRLILNPEIFNSYGHFDWNSVKEVDPSVPNLLTTSTIVRAVDDERVFQLFPSGDEGEKRWLNISATHFGASGRDWDSIYLINAFERQLYIEGIAITD